MSILRAVVIPTIVATPLWLGTLPVLFRGWSALGDLNWQTSDWLFGLFFTLVGLLLIGLPAASVVARLRFSSVAKAMLLLGIGVLGGGLVAMLHIFGIAVEAGTLGSAFPGILRIAPVGFLPGAIVALVWIIMNSDKLRVADKDV